MEKHKGIIVEESLEDKAILSEFEIISQSVSKGWHIDKVMATEKIFKRLIKIIKPGTWYAHFWKDKDVIAIFHNKVFRFQFDNKSTWKSVLEYGRSLGIPEEQLDFPIE